MSSDEIMIAFDKVTKKYSPHGGLKSVVGFLNRVKNGQLFSKNVVTEPDFVALNNVSFSIKRGERVGIIGPNGAGKSTTLKLISQTCYPSSGNISVNGEVGGLIELGAGFQPDLSGYDNIFLYTALHGYSQKETEPLVEKILAISELEPFIHLPLKRYSSGMKIRLGFAVAMIFTPDIVLMDEVLSVGDASFKKKSMRIMEKYLEGRTIIFVSHSMSQIKQICSRVIVINKGQVIYDGPTVKGIKRYMALSQNPKEAPEDEPTNLSSNSPSPEKTAESQKGVSKILVQNDYKRGLASLPPVTIQKIELFKLIADPENSSEHNEEISDTFIHEDRIFLRISFSKNTKTKNLKFRTRITKRFVGDLSETIAGAAFTIKRKKNDPQCETFSLDTKNLVPGYFHLHLYFVEGTAEEATSSFDLFKVDFRILEFERNYVGLVNLDWRHEVHLPPAEA